MSENKKTLVTSGCSFTFEKWNWPTFVCEDLNMNLINVGMACQGNGLISKKLIYTVNNLLKEKAPEEIVVGIMWSGIDRIDFYSDNIFERKNIDGWVENPTSVVEGKKNWVIGNFHWNDQYSSNWYKMFHTNVGATIETVKNILLTQWFLEKNGIKYFMTTFIDIFNSPWSPGIINDPDIKYLYDMINFDNFLPVNGCYEWVLENCGEIEGFGSKNHKGFHPTEYGHKRFANEVITPFLKNSNE